MKVYEAVRKYLDDNGIKQTKISEKTGIPMQTFNAMMNGNRTMYADDLAAICCALGVSATTFIPEEVSE